jgi:hypothetical protein
MAHVVFYAFSFCVVLHIETETKQKKCKKASVRCRPDNRLVVIVVWKVAREYCIGQAENNKEMGFAITKRTRDINKSNKT